MWQADIAVIDETVDEVVALVWAGFTLVTAGAEIAREVVATEVVSVVKGTVVPSRTQLLKVC